MDPVWLLDFDGVVNAIGRNPDRSVWPADEWIRAEASDAEETYPIMAARPVLRFITRAHAAGADIRWHSTWQQHIASPTEALGLPELPVLPAPEYLVEEAAGPLAPIPDTWWKEAGGRRTAATGRPMVWTDDDLRDNLGLRTAVDTRPLWPDLPVPTLAISPPRRVGLTPRHLRLIGAFLNLPASA